MMTNATATIAASTRARLTVAAALGLVGASLLTAGCAVAPFRAEPVFFPPAPATPHAVHLKSFNSLADLVPPKFSWVDVLRGGSASPHVRTPAGLDFQGDSLYVCDTGARAVHRWDLATGEARRLAGGGDGQLSSPVDVAVDQAGTVYVADTGLSEVVVLGTGGDVLRRISPADRDPYRPVAVTVRGTRLYVADAASHRIDVFSTTDGRPLGSFGRTGSEAGTFYFPMGLAVDGAGRVVVSDMMNSRGQVFDSDHQHVLSFGQPGDRYGDMGKPKGVAVGPDGTIFVADAEFARVHMFNSKGQLLMLLGGDGGPAASWMPFGLAVAGSLPPRLAEAVPDGFDADYFLFVSSTVGDKRISLYAISGGP